MTKTSPAVLSDAFFHAAQPKSDVFDLPGVGQVDVVELREADVAQIRARIESEKDTARRSKLFGLGLVVRSVHKDGTRVFSDTDVDRFADAGNSAVEKLAAAVLKVNGYGADPGN
jgi:hypothetical protein